MKLPTRSVALNLARRFNVGIDDPVNVVATIETKHVRQASLTRRGGLGDRKPGFKKPAKINVPITRQLIYIHGHGASSDWTWGWVALENADIEELYRAIPVGTPVTINP